MFDWLKKEKELPKEHFLEKKEPVIVRSAEEIELEELLGNLVICISNEMSNPTVGYGKEIVYITQAKIPKLIVHDIVKEKDVMPFGKIFRYTEQKFKALNKLEANERIAIIYNRMDEDVIDKSATKTEELLDSDIWEVKVFSAIEKWKVGNTPSVLRKKRM